MIHTWPKDPRFAPVAKETADGAVFLAVEIDGSTFYEPARQEFPPPPTSTPVSAGRIDITLSDGRRIQVEESTALAAVVSPARGLAV